jgi:phospholipase C
MRPSRRDTLKGIGLAIGSAAIGACGSEASGGGDDDGQDAGDTGDAANIDAAIDAQVDATVDAPSPEALLAGIDTFVVLMMENRSFDHYFGSLRLLEGRTDVNGLTGSETNPAPNGSPVAVHRLDNFTPADPPHGWDACHAQWNNGANDGFVREHEGSSQNDVMGYHVRSQLPQFYALADHSALCQNWFSSVMGPTWPNRFYLHGATSQGNRSNLPALGFRSIFSVLSEAGLSHKNYFHDVAWATGGYFKLDGNAPIEQFFDDAAAGQLPNFSIVDPQFFGNGANDDHPDHDIRLGQALIAAVVNALGASPQWNRCMLVITYDEHGGFYDHVPPPTTVDEREEFRQLGFRVPSVVVGPTARRGAIVGTTFEHVSVIKTITRRWNLPALNARVTEANDLSPCIDPAYLGSPQPAPVLPPVTMSKAAVRARHTVAAHPELAAALDRMQLPPSLDRRHRSAEITDRFLDCAAKVGAVKLRP